MTTMPAPPTDGNDRGARVLATGTDTGLRHPHLRALGEVAGPGGSALFRAGTSRNGPFPVDTPGPSAPRSGSRRQRGRR